MNREELTEALNAINARRRDAFIHAEDGRQAMAEVTTREDIGTILDAMQEVTDPFSRLVMRTAIDIYAEWDRSGRCTVCGMTTAQAKAENYDCWDEC